MALDCAICHEPTSLVLDFGMMPLANGYAEPDRCEPLAIRECDACGLYQLQDQVAPDTLFGNYTYRTGITQQHAIWQELMLARDTRLKGLAFEDPVVDIGGNDGTLLVASPMTRHRLNIDPYAPEQGVAGVMVIRQPWNVTTASQVLARYGPARFITAMNVWAHMPDLHASAEAAAVLLAPDGWLMVQSPWCRDFWRYQEYDTAYHEHIYYPGIRAMRALFQRHHMDVHDVEYLPNVHGGSLRYWIRHGNDGIRDSVERLQDIERDDTGAEVLYATWQACQQRYWDKLEGELWGIGAAAKATMYLAMTGVAGRLTRLFDDTPAKHGKRLPGTSLVVEPLVPMPPTDNVTAVIFAWNHRTALTARLRDLGFTGKIVMAHA